MEEQLVADRSHLRRLLHAHPDWPYQEYAEQIGRGSNAGSDACAPLLPTMRWSCGTVPQLVITCRLRSIRS